MARPQKKGLDYFPHDVDACSDEKVETLMMLYGAKGYAFYFILLERIYRNEGFELDISDEETKLILCRKMAITIEEFEQILISALKHKCFDKEYYSKYKILTSDGVKKRTTLVVEKRDRMREYYQKTKGNGVSDAETDAETKAETTQSKVKKSKVKKSKVKKSKEEESKEEKSKNNLSLSDESDPQTKSFKNWTEKEFYNEIALLDFGTKENKREFYEYWIEKSASGKMRFTLNRTWETNLRLKTWIRKSDSITVVKSQFAKPDPQLPRDYLQDTGT